MTRVIAGTAGGRRLQVPDGRGTRPTTDRVREALFSSLEAGLGGDGFGGAGLGGGSVEGRGIAFLDLYAGSGAIGLEALSRGAAAVTLVEADRRAAQVLQRNVDALGMAGAWVRVARVERMLATSAPTAHDVVFLDPPYDLASTALQRVLELVRTWGWIVPEGLVVVERGTRDEEFAWPAGYVADRSRRYGETTLWYGHATGEATF